MNETRLEERFLIERIGTLAGLPDPEDARRVGRVVSSVLLEQLAPDDAAWLAGRLPRQWAPSPHPRRAPVRFHDTLETFYERVAAREATQPGFAREHAQSCCRAIGEALGDADRDRLVRRLPDEIGAWLEALPRGEVTPSEPASIEHPPTTGGAAPRTLAEGRPGSQRPISEAAAPGAHEQSIARSENPHADEKLSSARGTTQERERETLAEGRPKTPRAPHRDGDKQRRR